MDHDQYLCESSVNVISNFTICVKSTNDDNFLYFSRFWVKNKPKLFLFSSEIAKITGIRSEWGITIQNWSETWLREMLIIAFERELSINVNSLANH